MNLLNIEFKARTNHLDELEQKFRSLNPVAKGTDHQVDTYFHTKSGRLKLREGNIEHSLIHYKRENTADAKQSDVILYEHSPDPALKAILTETNGIKVVVKKERKIYFIDNVKFHFDRVDNLGTFIEVEAIDADGRIGIETLQQQCSNYMDFFGITPQDLLSDSYSDMLLKNNHLEAQSIPGS